MLAESFICALTVLLGSPSSNACEDYGFAEGNMQQTKQLVN